MSGFKWFFASSRPKDTVRCGGVLVPGGGTDLKGEESAASGSLDHVVKHVHGLHDVFILQAGFKKEEHNEFQLVKDLESMMEKKSI